MEEIFEKILSACNEVDITDKETLNPVKSAIVELIDLYNAELLRFVGSDREFKHESQYLDRTDLLFLDFSKNAIRSLGQGRTEVYANRV